VALTGGALVSVGSRVSVFIGSSGVVAVFGLRPLGIWVPLLLEYDAFRRLIVVELY
jgi:hypothetical protein